MSTIATEFSFKVNKDAADSTTVKTTYDLSGLTAEDVNEWAARGIDIALQGKLRSGQVKVEDVHNKTYVVPKPGDRKRLSERDKLAKAIAPMIGKEFKDVTDDDIKAIVAKLG